MLYNKHRPTTFKELIGDFSGIENALKDNSLAHGIIFSGASGGGKTSISRIIANHLTSNPMSIIEMNGSNVNGVDDMRNLIEDLQYKPLGENRVVIIDEAQKLSASAWDILLKPIEDCAKFNYFIFCTTNGSKIPKAIKTRCTEYTLPPISEKDLFKLLKDVDSKENFNIDLTLLAQIATLANGSARKALVLLEQISTMDDKETFLKSQVIEGEEPVEVIELCRAILKSDWKEISKMLKELKATQESENLRRCVLGYLTSVILNGNIMVASKANCFMDNTYDNGWNGFVIMCANSVKK